MTGNARVLVLMADGFRELAVLPCVAALRDAGMKTVLVGLKERVRGTHGIAVAADVLLSEVPPDEGDTLVVIPGGLHCARSLLTDPRVHQLLAETIAHGGEVAVLSGAEGLVDAAVSGAATFRHQGKQGLEGFLQTCVADLGHDRPFADERT